MVHLRSDLTARFFVRTFGVHDVPRVIPIHRPFCIVLVALSIVVWAAASCDGPDSHGSNKPNPLQALPDEKVEPSNLVTDAIYKAADGMSEMHAALASYGFEVDSRSVRAVSVDQEYEILSKMLDVSIRINRASTAAMEKYLLVIRDGMFPGVSLNHWMIKPSDASDAQFFDRERCFLYYNTESSKARIVILPKSLPHGVHVDSQSNHSSVPVQNNTRLVVTVVLAGNDRVFGCTQIPPAPIPGVIESVPFSFPKYEMPDVGLIGRYILGMGYGNSPSRRERERLGIDSVYWPDSVAMTQISEPLSRDLWRVTADFPDAQAVTYFAVPLLDANGIRTGPRGTRDPAEADERRRKGLPFAGYTNDLFNVPESLMRAGHPLVRVPTPRLGLLAPAEFIVGISSDSLDEPWVQCYVKAETWQPFAEDVIFTDMPTPEQLQSGAVRALAVKADAPDEVLMKLFEAMTAEPVGSGTATNPVNATRPASKR
jgi:hypothetical protein